MFAGTVNVAVRFWIEERRFVCGLARPFVLFGRMEECVRNPVELGKEPNKNEFINWPSRCPKSWRVILRKRDSAVLLVALEEEEKAGQGVDWMNVESSGFTM